MWSPGFISDRSTRCDSSPIAGEIPLHVGPAVSERRAGRELAAWRYAITWSLEMEAAAML